MSKDFKDLEFIEDTTIEEIPEPHFTVKLFKRLAQAGILLMSAWFAFGSLFPPILFEEKPKPAIKQFLITPDGLGPVKIGMTHGEAQTALGLTLKKREVDPEAEPVNPKCFDVKPFNEKNLDLKAGYSLMISEGKVVRVDIDTAYFTTDNKARVGMAEEELQTTYNHKLTNELNLQTKKPEVAVSGLYGNQLTPEQIEAQKKSFQSAEHVWAFAPDANSDYRLVFGTRPNPEGKHFVYHIQAGKMPEVELGCPE